MKNSEFTPIPNFDEKVENIPDFHAVTSVKLGDLILDKVVDWDDKSWAWDFYDEQQYSRMCRKIEKRYFDREISILPVGQWKREFLRTMNEIMPKYKKLYAIISRKPDDDDINPLQERRDYYKGRKLDSSFPQTELHGDSDYASFGRDEENEELKEGKVVERINVYNKTFKDVDVMILDELEVLFSPLLAVNINSM